VSADLVAVDVPGPRRAVGRAEEDVRVPLIGNRALPRRADQDVGEPVAVHVPRAGHAAAELGEVRSAGHPPRVVLAQARRRAEIEEGLPPALAGLVVRGRAGDDISVSVAVHVAGSGEAHPVPGAQRLALADPRRGTLEPVRRSLVQERPSRNLQARLAPERLSDQELLVAVVIHVAGVGDRVAAGSQLHRAAGEPVGVGRVAGLPSSTSPQHLIGQTASQ
jgi:hypothetical protein